MESLLSDYRVVVGVAVLVLTTLVVCFSSDAFKPRKKHPVTLAGGTDINSNGGGGTEVTLELIDKVELSPDTRRFRFALPSEQHVLGLPVGQHVSLRFTDDQGKLVMRQYTPVTSDDVVGYVDFVIKVYFRNVHPKFPDGGRMSQHLESLKIGDTIQVAGPKGKLSYMGRGEIHIRHRIRDVVPEIRRAKKIGMIAGGTGITPMLQIMRHALKDPKDETEFFLLFANQTEEDILLRDEIDQMAAEFPHRVHVWYTIDRITRKEPQWEYSVGYVTKDMIQKHLPAPSAAVQIFMCGPPPMLKFAVLPALEELHFTPDMHFSF